MEDVALTKGVKRDCDRVVNELKKGGKNKKHVKENGSRKEVLGTEDQNVGSAYFVEKEGGGVHVDNTVIGTSVNESGKEGDVLMGNGVKVKAGMKKRKKDNRGDKGCKDTTTCQDGKKESRHDVVTSIEGSDEVIEKERSRDKRQSGELNEEALNNVKPKKKKIVKGNSKDDLRDTVITGVIHNGMVLKEDGRKKKKTGKTKKSNHLLAGKLDESTDNLVSRKCNPCPVEIQTQTSETENSVEMNGNGKENKYMKQKDKKKVNFSGKVEVLNESANSYIQKSTGKQDNFVRGKRFSAEEDGIVKQAVYKYIEERRLGEGGLDMVLHCRSHPEVKGCWRHIAKALPHRPLKSVYFRAHVLFMGGEKRKYTAEELELIRKFHERHGNKWSLLAEQLGRYSTHISLAWRRSNLRDRKKGPWSQEEYQTLFDLVNTDLRLKVSEDEEKKTRCGMLRDNIPWTAISNSLGTRLFDVCCKKWYQQLTSPMVAQGLWADADDYRLINELFSLDACCMEDVDWDNLLDHRFGDACRNRWNQMVMHIGNHKSLPFSEQVEILAKRYCPDLTEVREAWDSKPVTY